MHSKDNNSCLGVLIRIPGFGSETKKNCKIRMGLNPHRSGSRSSWYGSILDSDSDYPHPHQTTEKIKKLKKRKRKKGRDRICCSLEPKGGNWCCCCCDRATATRGDRPTAAAKRGDDKERRWRLLACFLRFATIELETAPATTTATVTERGCCCGAGSVLNLLTFLCFAFGKD